MLRCLARLAAVVAVYVSGYRRLGVYLLLLHHVPALLYSIAQLFWAREIRTDRMARLAISPTTAFRVWGVTWIVAQHATVFFVVATLLPDIRGTAAADPSGPALSTRLALFGAMLMFEAYQLSRFVLRHMLQVRCCATCGWRRVMEVGYRARTDTDLAPSACVLQDAAVRRLLRIEHYARSAAQRARNAVRS